MLGGSHGKIMGAGEIFLGTHIQIIVLGRIKYGFESRHGGYADGAWWKSLIYIGIIGRVDSEVLVEDATQGGVTGGKLYRRALFEDSERKR